MDRILIAACLYSDGEHNCCAVLVGRRHSATNLRRQVSRHQHARVGRSGHCESITIPTICAGDRVAGRAHERASRTGERCSEFFRSGHSRGNRACRRGTVPTRSGSRLLLCVGSMRQLAHLVGGAPVVVDSLSGAKSGLRTSSHGILPRSRISQADQRPVARQKNVRLSAVLP